MMLRDAVKQTPDCDGVVLGGHGLFTWGDTQREMLPEHRSRSSISSGNLYRITWSGGAQACLAAVARKRSIIIAHVRKRSFPLFAAEFQPSSG